MPERPKCHTIKIVLLTILLGFSFNIAEITANEGIQIYYVRYDIKSANNRIIDDSLLMVPAESEFRAENFAQFTSKGTISSASEGSKKDIDTIIKEDALKRILVSHGLKSVNSRDLQTIISYEGVAKTPIAIKKNFNAVENSYTYEAKIEFGAFDFPDQWESRNLKYKIKKAVSDFFELFK